MDDMDRNQHSVYLLYYHLIMVVKYRRKVIDDAISEQAKDLFVKIGDNYGLVLEEWISTTFMSCSAPNPRPSSRNLSMHTKAPAAV